MPTRLEKYWTESGRGERQGDVDKEGQPSHQRSDMMGKAEEVFDQACGGCVSALP